MKLCIVDTKAANLNSVVQALRRLNTDPKITRDLKELRQADRLILPGVGTASAVMRGIEGIAGECVSCIAPAKNESAEENAERNEDLKKFLQTTDKPLLGICLGMQVLTQSSAEVPLNSDLKSVATLGIMDTAVLKHDSRDLPLPHMGWNTVRHNGHYIFRDIAQDSFFYFVHSFSAPISEYTVAECEYGTKFSAAIAKDNFAGVQFHPEKSGAIGAKLLENFLTGVPL